MHLKSILFLITIPFFLNSLYSQDIKDVVGEKKRELLPLEKVYLHTDRSTYQLGEDLWYKAYLVTAYTNQLYTSSNNLYVELVSPEAKIVARNITRLDDGLGNGDFRLLDSLGIKQGIYQLRAYTNWMRNFDNDFVFEKEITIIDVNEYISDAISSHNNPLPVSNKAQKSIQISFFPEGGSLLKGVSSYIAFKATDSLGKPITLAGEIIDQNGAVLTSFKTEHEGMGKFLINPSDSQIFKAKIKSKDDNDLYFDLPKIHEQGYLLSTINQNENILVSIKTNQEMLEANKDKSVTLIAKVRGVNYFEGSQPLSEVMTSFILPTQEFPEGIVQLTLYDTDGKPNSERLVYFEKKPDYNISLATDKAVYKTKEKVALLLNSKQANGAVLPASFSVTAVEDFKDDAIASEMNICSYFLMQSDIRGKIHNPGFYFDKKNPKRLLYLDLLLLTQGWRDFIWKTWPDSDIQKSFKSEKALAINGMVQGEDKLPKANSLVNLVLINKGQTVMMQDTTNEKGQFFFDEIGFKGTATMLVSVFKNSKREKVQLILDSTFLKPLPVAYQNDIIIDTRTSLNRFLNVPIDEKTGNFLLNDPNMNLLDEVRLVGRKKINSIQDLVVSTYVAEEGRDQFPASMMNFILLSAPEVSMNKSRTGFKLPSLTDGDPLLVIDGYKIDAEIAMDNLELISPQDVVKIEVITSMKAAQYFGPEALSGAIMITTKNGRGIGSKSDPGSINTTLQGYYEERYFYAPDYNYETDTQIEDDRVTLYWNPYLHPDEEGMAEVSYYNDASPKAVTITAEGITASGIPVVLHANYEVKE